MLSNKNKIENFIDIILNIFLNKIEYILVLLIDKLTSYIIFMNNLIQKEYEIATIIFTEEQKKIWEGLCLFYKDKKDIIKKNKIIIYKK